MTDKGIFPSKDADFNTYINNVGPYLLANKARLEISDPNLALLGDQITDWNAVFPNSQNEDKRTKTITQKKNSQRKVIENQLRLIYGDIPKSVLNETDRNTLRLRERDSTPTVADVATKAPGIEMDEMVHRQHKLRFLNPFDPDSRQLPRQQRVFLEVGIGAANIAPKNIAFSRVYVVSRYFKSIPFSEEEVGQTAYYRARFQNTREEQGPPSEIFSAVVS